MGGGVYLALWSEVGERIHKLNSQQSCIIYACLSLEAVYGVFGGAIIRSCLDALIVLLESKLNQRFFSSNYELTEEVAV